MKCKHEGTIRWMITGELCKKNSYGVRPHSKKKVPVLHCVLCGEDIIVSFEKVNQKQ